MDTRLTKWNVDKVTTKTSNKDEAIMATVYGMKEIQCKLIEEQNHWYEEQEEHFPRNMDEVKPGKVNGNFCQTWAEIGPIKGGAVVLRIS